MAGRPTLLTEAMHVAMVAYAKDGISLQVSAQACGITARCAELWFATGERDWNSWGDETEPEVPSKAAFFREVRRAQAKWEIGAWKDALDGDGQGIGNGPGKSAQWALERTKGKRYQPKIQLQVESEMAVVIDVLSAVLPTEMYAEVLAAIGDLDDDGIPRVLSAAVDEPAAERDAALAELDRRHTR